ncbi:hypothetical protein SUGI_0865000 [Cryptomeria japonica]|nr:hypothetical protein SUGI_0865000 [Cryptomeria japonica]
MRAKFYLQLVMTLAMDSWVGPFLRGGLAKHFMTLSEPAHSWRRNSNPKGSIQTEIKEKIFGLPRLNFRIIRGL